MSTKIYNGFRFASSDMAVIHGWLMEWRRELETLHLRALAEHYAEFAVTMLDRAVLEPGKGGGKTPLIEAYHDVVGRQREIKKTGHRDPGIDFDFSVSVMPYEGRVYGIVYTERWQWCHLWMAKEFVEDFSYWNASDRPKDISKAEWEHRSDVWHDVLGAGVSRVPAMCGFSADCTHEMTMPTTEQIVEAIPSFDRRVRKHADNAVMTAEFTRRRERLVAETAPEDEKYLPSQMFGLVSQCQLWLGTDEGKALLAPEIVRIGNALKKEVGRDDLIHPLPEIAQCSASGGDLPAPDAKPEDVAD